MKTASTSFLPVLATMLLFLDLAPSVRADAATNAFVTIRAVGSDVTRVDGRNFAASEDGEIEIDAQPGWTLLTPSRVRVTKNQSPRYRVRSVSNEDEGEGDVWRTVVEVVTNHLSDPIVAASVAVGGPYVYALPDDGTDAAATFAASIKKLGMHETETRTTTYRNGAVVDESVETSEPFTLDIDRWSWDWIFEDSGTTNRQAFATPVQHLTNGTYTATGTVEGHSSRCAACSATAAASTNIVVSLLSVSCDPWIGQDRTGDPSAPYESPKVTATASLEPENPDVKKVTWGGENQCEKGITNDWSLTLWTENRDLASDTYLGEKVTASVAGATATTNFTIVKVDISVNGSNEETEETVGKHIPCITFGGSTPPDNASAVFCPTSVSLIPSNCVPSGVAILPSSGISAFVAPPFNTAVTTINGGGSILVWGKDISKASPDQEALVRHDSSGAQDKVRFTNYAISYTVIHPAPSNNNLQRTKLGVGEQVLAVVKPTGSGATWSANAGTCTNYSPDIVIYEAPHTSANDNLKACFPSESSVAISFEIIEPTGVEIDGDVSPISFSNGVCGAGMKIPLKMLPLDVNFYRVMFVEVSKPAIDISGYFTNGWVDLTHHVAPWGALSTNGNHLIGRDKAAINNLPSPWSDGGFTWPIPAKWRVGETGAENSLAVWSDQVFTLEHDGTASVSKFGKIAKRKPDEVDSTIEDEN